MVAIITVFDILKYYYCPREFYLLKVLKVPFVPKAKMIYGKSQQEKEEKRKLLWKFFNNSLDHVRFNVYLEDSNLGLSGILDGILYFKDGSIAPLEMKYTDFTDLNLQKKKQIYAYAKLIDHSYGTNVNVGYILFIKQRRIKRLPVTHDDKYFIERDVKKLTELLLSERIPPYTDAKKCAYCEVKKFCGKGGF